MRFLLIEFDISMLHQEMDVFGPQLSLIKVDEIWSELVFFFLKKKTQFSQSVGL